MSESTAEVKLESSEPSQKTPEEIMEEKQLILKQVEYYFGDTNYPKDLFLKELSEKDPDGWVPIAMIRQFRKMQVYTDNELIVEALRESPKLLEVDESGTKGSFFIQFDSHETAKKISEMKLEFNGAPIKMMMKFDYCEMKCIEKGLDPNTMRMQGQKKIKDKVLSFRKGCLLKFEGTGPDATWETIRKEVHDKYGKVSFVSFNYLERNGIIHFEEAIAKDLATKISNDNVEFDGVKPSFSFVEGQEEIDYYQRKREYINVCPTSTAGSESNPTDVAESSQESNVKSEEDANFSKETDSKETTAVNSVSADPDAKVEGLNPEAKIESDSDATIKGLNSDTSIVSSGSKRKLNDSTDPDDSPKENKVIKLDAVEDSSS
ncbi:4640_t:CDS:2 [Acaulospora colombiana]|uniref:4640_t:CDS:1 n=1 Tax=Acaulospora colombiana TaxID=27376 RepID=A0ACA9N155_9GLOM|nr:4640_t:CDS:2 [Acaulospora colombiana]